jgi:hypothetical protein
MRVVHQIPNPHCKITIFQWNNRYIIKLEVDHLEQTFKINQFDVTNEDELLKILDETFIQEAILRFTTMDESIYQALKRS